MITAVPYREPCMSEQRWQQERRVSGCIAEASRGGEHGLLRAGGAGSEAAVSRSTVHRHGEQAAEPQSEIRSHCISRI